MDTAHRKQKLYYWLLLTVTVSRAFDTNDKAELLWGRIVLIASLLGCGVIVTGIAGAAGDWFQSLPKWSIICFGVVVVCACLLETARKIHNDQNKAHAEELATWKPSNASMPAFAARVRALRADAAYLLAGITKTSQRKDYGLTAKMILEATRIYFCLEEDLEGKSGLSTERQEELYSIFTLVISHIQKIQAKIEAKEPGYDSPVRLQQAIEHLVIAFDTLDERISASR